VFGGTRIPVRTVMRSPPVIVNPTSTVSDIVDVMITENIGAVIVVIDATKAIGIITERDILEKVMHVDKNPRETIAQEIMSSPVRTVDHDTSLRDATTLMASYGIRRLTVTKDGVLVGQLTALRASSARPYVNGVVLGMIVGTLIGAIITLLSIQ
jgi:CBS domain-containing protein